MVGTAAFVAEPRSRKTELTPAALLQQNEIFRGSGGVSEENRAQGFKPAFYDMETGVVHPSCFASGLPAPMHLLDGLPQELVLSRLDCGRVTVAKSGVVAGFVRQGHFFTREQAAQTTVQLCDRPQQLSNPQHHHQLLDVWERFVLDQSYANEVIRPVVQDSWRRCHASHVDPLLRHAPLTVDQVALEYRRYRQAELRDAAHPVLQRAGELLFKTRSVILLADEDGLILDATGDRSARTTAQRVNLVEGGLWGEAAVGTNAIGTALAAAEAVQMYGGEHFCSGIKRYTCSADVIRDPHDGRILGVVDLSSLTDSYQCNALDFAMAAARLIESNLATRYFRSREQVLEGTGKLFKRWQTEGLLAFDRRGRLVKANGFAHSALQNLGVELHLTPQTRIAALDLDSTHSGEEVPHWLTAPRLHPIRNRGREVGTLVALS